MAALLDVSGVTLRYKTSSAVITATDKVSFTVEAHDNLAPGKPQVTVSRRCSLFVFQEALGGLSIKELGLGSQIAPFATADDSLECLPGLIRAPQPQKGAAPREIELGDVRVGTRQLFLKRLGARQGLAPLLCAHEALNVPGADQPSKTVGIRGTRRLGLKCSKDWLGQLGLILS